MDNSESTAKDRLNSLKRTQTRTTSDTSTVAADRLRNFIERVERLEEEKTAIMDDIKEVYAEAKGEDYDVKTLKTVIRIRRMDRADRQEQESMLDLYMTALGENNEQS